MSFHKVELFGRVTYSPELSYHELLSREDALKKTLHTILEGAGGDFIHFEALGDALRFQCALFEEREDIFHTICDGLALHMQNGLDARLVVVDKDLDTIFSYVIVDGKWQEGTVMLPTGGKLCSFEPVMERVTTDHPQRESKSSASINPRYYREL